MAQKDEKLAGTSPLVWLSIFCASFVAYWPALRGGMLWDDSSHVTSPGLQSAHGLWRIWFDLGATQQYYPLLHSAFWVEHRLWGDATLGYHLTNVVLHAVCACLVVLIVRRLALPGAWLAGLLFALHPVCVESVAWISEQKSTLSGVFYLGSALLYLQFDRSRKISRYVAALGLFVLALLSKSVTATLPAALLVVFWWQRGRLDWKRDVSPLAPWLAIGAGSGLFTAWVEKTYIGADVSLSLVQRFLLAGRVLWFYAFKLVLPIELTFFYPRWTIDAGEWWQWLFPMGAIAVAATLWLLARRNRGPLAGFLIFAGTLFPVLGFFSVYPFRYSFVADHFQYLACLGLLVPAAVALSRFRASAVIAVALGVATFAQSGIYRDSDTLYRATIERNPDSWLAHNNLGSSLLAMPGHRDEAVVEFEAALRIKPNYSEAHLSLGNALLETPGRLADAIAEYQAAVRNEPISERAHNNLGYALLRAGRPQEAIGELQEALRLRPGYPEAHNNLGNVYSVMGGRLPEAIQEYQAAVRNEPNFPEAYNNLGRALAQVPGKLPEAIEQFQVAIRLRPEYGSAHHNLGNALSEMPDRREEAIAEYREAVRIEPNLANSHYGLGNGLSRVPGKEAEAMAEYQAALRIEPNNVDAHYMLGALLERVGRKAEAVAEYEAVLRVRAIPQVQERLSRLRGR